MYCTDCGSKMRQLAFPMSNPWHCDGCERGGREGGTSAGEESPWFASVDLAKTNPIGGGLFEVTNVTAMACRDPEDARREGYTLVRIVQYAGDLHEYTNEWRGWAALQAPIVRVRPEERL